MMVASGEKGTIDVTVDNIHLARVVLLKDPITSELDGVKWVYFSFTILPPYKIPENFNQKNAIEFFDEVKAKRNLFADGRLKSFWFCEEIEELLK
jgi:hypothetical protein